MARCGIPGGDRPVLASRGQRFAVGGEGDGSDVPSPMRYEPAQLSARAHVPELEVIRPVSVSHGQGLSIRGEGNRSNPARYVNPTRPYDEPAQLLAGIRVPETDRAAVSPAGQDLAVGRKGDAIYAGAGTEAHCPQAGYRPARQRIAEAVGGCLGLFFGLRLLLRFRFRLPLSFLPLLQFQRCR